MKIYHDILKYPLDKKFYEKYILKNGLTILNIYDRTLTECTALLRVNVSDYLPDFNNKFSGLSHLLKHVIINKKEFMNKITSYGATADAMTSPVDSKYYFTSLDTVFINILNNFIDCFLNPNFSDDIIEREIIVVDNEYHMRKNNEHYKFYTHLPIITNENTFFSKFSQGNKKSFQTSTKNNKNLLIITALKKLFDRYYVGKNMILILNTNIESIIIFKLFNKLEKIQ